MKLFLVIASVVLACAALAFALLKLRAHARARFAEEMRRKLKDLRRTAQTWQGSAYDLVPFDNDHYQGALGQPWRLIEIRLGAAHSWLLYIDRQERYRVGLKRDDVETWYPSRYEWSEEAWLKQAVDLLLFQIASLPPPRTYQEDMARSRKQWEERLAAVEAEFSSYASTGPVPDDGMDDMD